MNVYEYQAKEIFRQNGIVTPEGQVVETEEELIAVYRTLGPHVMLKAQVQTGGRGKAGGIRGVSSEKEAVENFKELLKLTIKGLPVNKILVEQKVAIKNEYYLGITIDPSTNLPALILSSKGGMDVEKLSEDFPDQLRELIIDPRYPLANFAVKDLVIKLGFSSQLVNQYVKLINKLYHVFAENKAILVEINPLVLTEDNQLIAADGRLAIDDNAINFYPNLTKLAEETDSKTIERQLKKQGIDYVELEGNVGIISVGAGETMATMDLISREGGKPACFLDFSGGVKPETITVALKTVINRPEVKSILINIFGGLTRIDKVAEGLIYAMKSLGKVSKPFAIRLEGTNADVGRKLIKEYGLEPCFSLQEAVTKAVQGVRA